MGTNLNYYFNDVVPDVQKELIIDLLLDGNQLQLCEKENIELTNGIRILDKYNHNNSCLLILEARYGLVEKYIDVKNMVYTHFLKNNELKIEKGIDLNFYFTDPCPGVLKELKLKLLVNNTIVEIIRNEIFFKDNEIIVVNNKNKIKNDVNLNTHFINLDFVFVPQIIQLANDFINHYMISVNQNINVLHLRIKEEAINYWSYYNGIGNVVYSNLLENKYIDLIQKYFNKNDNIIVLTYDTNNSVINYLQENNYHFFVRENKIYDTKFETAIDMQIGFNCNNIFIGNTNSKFTQIINSKIKNKKSVLINLKNIGEIVVNKFYG
jgi:hypothetical protein